MLVTALNTKIGYYKNFIANEALDPKIKADFEKMLAKLKAEGMEIVPLNFFDSEMLVSTYYALAMAETASNLAGQKQLKHEAICRRRVQAKFWLKIVEFWIEIDIW